MDDLMKSLYVSASGMRAQSDRLKIVSQNVANKETTALVPGGDPYRRKVLSFKNVLDRETGVEKVKVSKYGVDRSDFMLKYDPGHPAADQNGYVKYPNVNTMVELVDMREAQRGYEANMNVIEVSKSMLMQTVGLLRN